MTESYRWALLGLVGMVTSLTGCVAYDSPPLTTACAYVERDLTLAWADRTYWCAPLGLQPVAASRGVDPEQWYRGGR